MKWFMVYLLPSVRMSVHFVQKYQCVFILVLAQTSLGVILSVHYVLCISSR